MSAETLPKTNSAEANPSVPTVEELNSLVNPSFSETNPDNRELSPAASFMKRSVNRIAGVFERRALNKAHGEALKDDRSRTETLQNEAFDSYAENIDFTQKREQDERREAYEAKIEDAKALVKKVGRLALSGVAEAGTIALGIGLLAGESTVKLSVNAANKTKDLAETGALYAMSAADKVADLAETGALTAMYAADRGRDIISDSVESLRQKLQDRAEAAIKSREARRESWNKRKEALFSRGREVIDGSKEKGRDALARANAARAAGSAALSAIASAKNAAATTYNTHREQNSL